MFEYTIEDDHEVGPILKITRRVGDKEAHVAICRIENMPDRQFEVLVSSAKKQLMEHKFE